MGLKTRRAAKPIALALALGALGMAAGCGDDDEPATTAPEATDEAAATTDAAATETASLDVATIEERLLELLQERDKTIESVECPDDADLEGGDNECTVTGSKGDGDVTFSIQAGETYPLSYQGTYDGTIMAGSAPLEP